MVAQDGGMVEEPRGTMEDRVTTSPTGMQEAEGRAQGACLSSGPGLRGGQCGQSAHGVWGGVGQLAQQTQAAEQVRGSGG